MTSSAPGPGQQLVSPAAHLHAAPAYAVQPAPTVSTSFSSTAASPTSSSSSSGAPSGSSSHKPIPGAPSPTLRPFTPRELKQLVLEYLCSRCYVDTAKAFANDIALADEAAAGTSEGASATSVDRGAVSAEAMEGIEATPEPRAGGESRAAGDGSPAANGKSVAFLDGDGGTEDEDEDGDVVEGSLLSKADVQDARLRRKIRDSILSGRISHAVDLLNEHYPSVLAPTTTPATTPPTASGHSSPSKLAPSHPLSPKHSRCTPQTFFVAPSPPSSSSSAAPVHSSSSKALIGAYFGPHAQSLAPAILSLNLQTQVFVELMRSAYATSAHSTPSTPTPSLAGGAGASSAAGAGAGAGDDADMSASTSSLGTFSILNVAIAQAQALAEKVSHLPPGRERDGWDHERVDVSALLAYKNIETCEVRGYFDEARKEALAEMVNAAVLQHTSRTPMPLLSLAARQATAFWSTLREMNVPFPPPSSSSKSSADATSNGKAKLAKTAPAFDLHSFLHERDPGAPSSGAAADGDVEMAP
ncbi:hypothetical protein JCM8208_003149 [Rhodotorula glutinis]